MAHGGVGSHMPIEDFKEQESAHVSNDYRDTSQRKGTIKTGTEALLNMATC